MSQLPPDAGADEGAAPTPDDASDLQTTPPGQQDADLAREDLAERAEEPAAIDESSPADAGPPEEPGDEPTDVTAAQPTTGEQPAGEEPSEAPAKPKRSVVARYGHMRSVGQFRYNLDRVPRVGEKVVVRTERGVELGEVLADVCDHTCHGRLEAEQLKTFVKSNGPEYPFRRDGKVLRLANPQDVIDQRHLDSSAREEGAFCRQLIRQLELKMRLVAVEHLLGGERILFYFSAETRVDFRELVRQLASQYRTRIEMRQVGARDEARLVADYERCGQRCCCQQFIKDLRPVSMRMAKTQKATLDPSKISGRCGRLMCCLRYEDATYEELRKKLPKKNTWVRTADRVGRVVDTHILTQLVRLELPGRDFEVVAVEDILEHGVEPPPKDEKVGSPPRVRVPRQRPTALLRDTVLEPPPGADAQTAGATNASERAAPSSADEGQAPKKKRRRGRRRSKGRSSGNGQPQPQAGEGSAPSQAAPDSGNSGGEGPAAPSNRKKRRRRRKKKPSGDGGGSIAE